MTSTADSSNTAASQTDLGKPLIILAWTLFAVAAAIVALRIWTRLFYLKTRLALHDWLILCAIVSEIVHAALLNLAQQHGLGQHIWNLQGPSISKAAHYMHISESFSIITSYFGRMSFAAFLLSVLGKTAKARRYILYSLIVVDTIINILVAVQTYTQCGRHISALWDHQLAEVVHCESPDVETYIGYVQASINSLCDLILTIIPITIVTKLKLPRSTKIGLGALLTLSSCAFIASIAKAVEIQQLSNGPDFTCEFPQFPAQSPLPLTSNRQLCRPPVQRDSGKRCRRHRRLRSHAARSMAQERHRHRRPLPACLRRERLPGLALLGQPEREEQHYHHHHLGSRREDARRRRGVHARTRSRCCAAGRDKANDRDERVRRWGAWVESVPQLERP
ncbi:hypothetical protein K461DRAFT_273619 [Myriangium duriaei CBS 260.36]|uniref:Rhodopsin domain-containing protein n=1 Tax=Myriangium duriaei CBS 260.36 TaxID=1168546 RepID=A0A9P4MJS3_9PEZI|nr:hypothetical protein K461DRAFT_273619 [Myriangium duriaei CBS 260.36]